MLNLDKLGNFIRTARHPEWYHGGYAESPFFEGWYYKLVDKTETHCYMINPGVSLNPGGVGLHAFVQVLDGVTGMTIYHSYPLASFWAARNTFYARIGPNYFTAGSLKLDLPGPDLALKGDLTFYNTTSWPAPGTMGPYMWIPTMECYHSALSLDHSIHGNLTLENKTITFTDGKGYLEKSWGQSFPSAWVRIQSNHFDANSTSLVASVATTPWSNPPFRGMIIGLLHQGTIYRFATYTGAVIEHLDIGADTVTWTVRDCLYRLRLHAQRDVTGNLRGPSKAGMDFQVAEALTATVNVRLTSLHDGTIIFEGTGRNSRLAITEDVAPLLVTTHREHNE